ncbi:ATP-binding cassette domain-containing protein [Treponema phagedenis]|uniref:ATP-binding cassette domain-containing protein n=1 Tax=Treponema phagedenis TaxID=162 RepID=UPI0001F63D49|nr:ATP-binding cassette domain-containing protein [Treponema phagedenis]EFW37356.1 ABC transporter, ATP-binding protein [Treponema phagedenis F0421]TYT79157.1 ATP-binding cassette domain-containing protein [Treponema phagedenis]
MPKVIAEFQDVSISYGKKNTTEILNNVHLKIYEGDVLGITGESGSGKSTLGFALTGLKSISRGKIISPLKTVGMVLQNPETAFDPLKTVGWTLMQTKRAYLKRNSLTVDKNIIKTELKSFFKDFAITPSRLNDKPQTFSGGELQRISIMCALLSGSKLIVLDEVTSMLDVITQAKIMHLLLALKKAYRLTYVFISHDIELVKRVCNRQYQVVDKTLVFVN